MIRSEPNELRMKTFPEYFSVTFPIMHEFTPAGSFFISLRTISVNSSGIAATIVPSLARYKGS